MAKKCIICGEYSGNYPFCYKHMHEMVDGKIIKCEECGIWHYTDTPCKCTKEPENGETHNIGSNTRKYKDEIEYRCQDGHWVKSKSKRDIDNYLYNHNIRHAYENTLYTDEDIPIHPDFYLPDHNAYIEHWGYGKEKKGYTLTKIKKLLYYRRSGLTVICTYENTDAEDIESALDYKLNHFTTGKVNFDDPTMTPELAKKLEAELAQWKENNASKIEKGTNAENHTKPQHNSVECVTLSSDNREKIKKEESSEIASDDIVRILHNLEKEIKQEPQTLPCDSHEELKKQLAEKTDDEESDSIMAPLIIGFIIFFVFVIIIGFLASSSK